MRTFEEIKSNMKANRLAIMQRAAQMLERKDLHDFEVHAARMTIDDCQSNIDNIDEVTVIEIGATTNSLITAIQRAYQLHLNAYWQNFEGFLEDYVIGITPDGRLKNGVYFGQSECIILNVGLNELLCFKGRDPFSAEAGNLLRQTVNAKLGTNIPMAGVPEQALKNYETVAFGEDEEAKDKAFVELKEIQRDSGALRNGGTYYTLATNLTYQDAKNRCAARGI